MHTDFLKILTLQIPSHCPQNPIIDYSKRDYSSLEIVALCMTKLNIKEKCKIYTKRECEILSPTKISFFTWEERSLGFFLQLLFIFTN